MWDHFPIFRLFFSRGGPRETETYTFPIFFFPYFGPEARNPFCSRPTGSQQWRIFADCPLKCSDAISHCEQQQHTSNVNKPAPDPGRKAQAPPSYGSGRYGFGVFGAQDSVLRDRCSVGRRHAFFLDHFAKHLSSVLGRTELCHEVRNPGPHSLKLILSKRAYTCDVLQT